MKTGKERAAVRSSRGEIGVTHQLFTVVVTIITLSVTAAYYLLPVPVEVKQVLYILDSLNQRRSEERKSEIEALREEMARLFAQQERVAESETSSLRDEVAQLRFVLSEAELTRRGQSDE